MTTRTGKSSRTGADALLGVPPPLVGTALQPVSGVQWVPRDELTANDYNPNIVAP
jgi:hypothetical protein